MRRRFFDSPNGGGGIVPLINIGGHPGYNYTVVILMDGMDSYIQNPLDYISEDNFELVYSAYGDIPTFELKNSGINVQVNLGYENYTNRGFIYKFTYNDFVAYFGFGTAYNYKEAAIELGVNMVTDCTLKMII